MDLTGEQRIAAPRDIVWAALNDVAVLKRCIPGCESIEKTSDTEMTARVVLKIGPVKAGFGGKVTLSEIDPPNGYRIAGEGQGGVAGFARGSALVRLEPDGGETILRYEAKGEIGGKIAQLGSRLVDSTAHKLAGDFFAALGAAVGAPAAAPAAQPEPVPEPVAEPAPQPAIAAEGGSAAAAAPVKAAWYKRLFGSADRPAG